MSQSRDYLVDAASLREQLQLLLEDEAKKIRIQEREAQIPVWENDNQKIQARFYQALEDLLVSLASLKRPLTELVKLVPLGFEVPALIFDLYPDWFAGFDPHITKVKQVEQAGSVSVRLTWIPFIPEKGELVSPQRHRYYFLKVVLALLPGDGLVLVTPGNLKHLGIALDRLWHEPVARLDI